MQKDYQAIGLKCGLEIHQQIDSEKKLFCNCRSELSSTPPVQFFSRKLRAVSGELGEIDVAAASETLAGRQFQYQIYQDTVCNVEADEEPPRPLNMDAMETALKVALMLNCKIPDEIHVMRKIVVDGSNTSGFQRTAIIGTGGFVDTVKGKVGIANVSIEEDSAQIVVEADGRKMYGLDRLGIPLIEIGTGPDIRTPEQAMEVAERIGLILRSTGRVKRGLGTIRQDLNVSISGGSRIELKGVQELSEIPKYIDMEILRQQGLLEIKKALPGKKPSELKAEDLTNLLKGSNSKIMSAGIAAGSIALGLKLNGFTGLLGKELQPNRRFGTEISDFAKKHSGCGILHSDENLQKLGLSEQEIVGISKALGCGEKDAFILSICPETKARSVVAAILARVTEAFSGVPMEVRKVTEDCSSAFLRPMSGSARLYPETDIPPIKIEKCFLEKIGSELPELFDVKQKRFYSRYGLAGDLSKQIIYSGRADLFEQIVKLGFDASLVARLLTSTFKDISRRDNLPANDLPDRKILEVFLSLNPSNATKESLHEIFKKLAGNPDSQISELAKQSGITETDLREIVRKVILENRDALSKPTRENIFMGLVMKEVRGKVQGKVIMGVIREELKSFRDN